MRIEKGMGDEGWGMRDGSVACSFLSFFVGAGSFSALFWFFRLEFL